MPEQSVAGPTDGPIVAPSESSAHVESSDLEPVLGSEVVVDVMEEPTGTFGTLSDASLPTRRSFFARSLEATLLATPLMPLSVTLPAETLDVTKYLFTDQRHQLRNGVTLRNLGVWHTESEFRKWQDYFVEAIQEADIVLLENSGGLFYFGALEGVATAYDKRVINIDCRNEAAIEIGATCHNVLPVWAALRTLTNSEPPSLARRAINWLMAFVPATLFMPSMQYLASSLFYPSEDSIVPGDIAYVTDARTVNMLAQILDIADRNPGAKLLAVTGDAHARGFEKYLSGEEGRGDFEKRRVIYQQTYNRVFGEGQEVLREKRDKPYERSH